ncbi:relaxase/mobilization nuclease domain-containing protein [Paraburkholderia madseniana]|uniref:Relaxase/mobilization nuclease domain-containing protein n=1 Tax=Paraburkholderia madseniana TaxID=2599607 RepID=A0A6N6W0Z2_9BURK|nr:LPD7 domain-containing protein [Paraburkholderia madseniana]KAE8754235.1 relaxase/mobilization nuclease domain-containing protein [Paraburkholderia madseniana]
MLIRVRGYHDGIKDYLEKGQKQGREMERDEMDERVILAGDLDLTNDIIQSIDTDAERYLNVTMSFKEDEVDRDLLGEIVREFEAFAFAAYRRDEYNFYAEAHVPRIKSYADRKTGEPVERKVHVHIVIPEMNLVTGRRLDPFGKVDHNERYLEAFQEHINAKYGLASPKDNRRVQFTDASEMISRYKGDVFEGANRELKASILEAVMTRDVTRYDDFRALITEYGETRTRNAGRESEYENVKPAGAAKGVNLKEFVFSREFIELDATAKRESLESNVHAQYVEPGVSRDTRQIYLDALGAWHDTRAREIKYLNSGSGFYKTYQAASPAEQRRILDHREQRFYDATGGLNERTRQSHDRSGHWRDWRRIGAAGAGGRARERGAGREPEGAGQSQQWWNELERAHREITGRWRAGADHDFDARFDRSGAPSQSAHRVHGVSGRGVDGDAARRQVLLPPDALLELGNQQAERIDALRWSGDRERGGREQLGISVPRLRWREGADRDFEPGGSYDEREDRWQWSGERDAVDRSAGEPEWKAMVDRMFVAWDQADEAGRTRLARTGAEKFMRAGGPFGAREPFGLSGGRLPAGFGPREEIRSLADVQSFDAIDSLPFEVRPTDSPPTTDAASVDFNASAHASTGRAADTVRDQFARDLSEARTARRARERDEFTEIRATLDAGRLLAALAHSHGLIVEKYAIGKGADGGDRIRAGSRNLNVSDFLTKEMNLSWEEAAQLLRETYRAQTGRDPEHAPRRTPERDLWGEFQQWRSAYRNELRRAWDAQADHESERRKAVKSEFYSARSALVDRIDLSGAQRREQLSAARVARLEAEAALRVQIAKERDALKGAASRPLSEQYRDFLQERAQKGDERALRELRRMQQIRLRTKRADDARAVIFSALSHAVKPPAAHDRNEIIYAGPAITYEVRAGGEVDYRKEGVAFLVDEGRTLRLWDSEREAIEIALRFAQQKFGSTLSLSGPEPFQAAAARVAADTRMRIVFDQPELESIRQVRLAELDAEALERRAAQRQRETWERDELRDAVRHPTPPTPEDPSNPDQDAASPADPDAPGNGPDIDR